MIPLGIKNIGNRQGREVLISADLRSFNGCFAMRDLRLMWQKRGGTNHRELLQNEGYSGVPIFALLPVYCAICNAAGCAEPMSI
jgi:hypothetical protein